MTVNFKINGLLGLLVYVCSRYQKQNNISLSNEIFQPSLTSNTTNYSVIINTMFILYSYFKIIRLILKVYQLPDYYNQT